MNTWIHLYCTGKVLFQMGSRFQVSRRRLMWFWILDQSGVTSIWQQLEVTWHIGPPKFQKIISLSLGTNFKFWIGQSIDLVELYHKLFLLLKLNGQFSQNFEYQYRFPGILDQNEEPEQVGTTAVHLVKLSTSACGYLGTWHATSWYYCRFGEKRSCPEIKSLHKTSTNQ
jgi:hypothetical protein